MPEIRAFTVTVTRSIELSATDAVQAAELGAQLLRASGEEFGGLSRSLPTVVYRGPREESLEVTRR